MKKMKSLNLAQNEVDDIKSKFERHILTDGERYNKVIDVWTHTANQDGDDYDECN